MCMVRSTYERLGLLQYAMRLCYHSITKQVLKRILPNLWEDISTKLTHNKHLIVFGNPSIIYFWRNWGMFCSCEIYLISAPMYNCLPFVKKIICQNEYHWSWLMCIYSSDFPHMFVSSIIKPSSINTNYNFRIWKENCYIPNIFFIYRRYARLFS